MKWSVSEQKYFREDCKNCRGIFAESIDGREDGGEKKMLKTLLFLMLRIQKLSCATVDVDDRWDFFDAPDSSRLD